MTRRSPWSHLQSHFGLDTLSWTRRGALVTGLDFSPAAIDVARAAATAAGLDARFVVGDVHDTMTLLGQEAFDIVYTGFGALTWLPNLDRWATLVAGLLASGGHPFTTVTDDDLVARRSYAPDTPVEMDEPGPTSTSAPRPATTEPDAGTTASDKSSRPSPPPG